jgi:hypothetical protein
MLAATVGAPAFPSAGTYAYSASMGGQAVGRWTVTVKPSDSGPQIDENSTASLGGLQLSATATLSLAADLSPVKYAGSYRSAMQNPTVDVVLTPSAATITGSSGGATSTLALQANTHHFVVVEQGLLAGLFALPAQFAAWKDASVTWIAPMNASSQALGINATAPAARPANLPAQDVALSITGPIPVTLWYDPATLVPDQIVVPSQDAVLTRIR